MWYFSDIHFLCKKILYFGNCFISYFQIVYKAKEDTDCCTRNLCGPARPFDLAIKVPVPVTRVFRIRIVFEFKWLADPDPGNVVWGRYVVIGNTKISFGPALFICKARCFFSKTKSPWYNFLLWLSFLQIWTLLGIFSRSRKWWFRWRHYLLKLSKIWSVSFDE